jgi:uncharacterized damage-inducible protein DinB
MKELLIENFEYDLWANLRWLEFLPHATPDEQQIFAHIQGAQKIWADRVAGISATELPSAEPTLETLTTLNQTWIELIKSNDPEEVIHYKRTTGEPQSLQFSQIARQVANHGTYHRGQMRGLCQARNCTDFPETDILLFFWAK